MTNNISLKSVGGYHFGGIINLSKYNGSYFKSNKPDEFNIIHNAIIISITYLADKIYDETNGYSGNCWKAIIDDSRLINGENICKLVFRNFSDLVSHYESQDMNFYPLKIIYNKTT